MNTRTVPASNDRHRRRPSPWSHRGRGAHAFDRPDHGVTVAAVPWARHGAGHTRAFDDQVAWLATHCSKSAVVELMRVAWRTVGSIAGRVVADARAVRDPFDGLVRIGIDEISYRRGHQYLMVVVDHDTARQAGKLAWIARHNHRLYRAYLLKEQLRLVFAHRGDEAVAMLDAWLARARRCRIPAFVELYHRIKKHARRDHRLTRLDGLSNGLTESVNTKSCGC